MKKIYFVVILLICGLSTGFAQVNLQVIAPISNGATTQARAPNGNASHACMRGCFIVPASELTSLVTGTNVSSFGFTMTTGVSGAPVTGSMTVYLQNTNDVSYLKGTTWTTAITGMATVYNGNMTIPVAAGTTSINLSLAPTFTYTGGGIYVAYDWACNGPYSSGFATYAADNTMPAGGASAATTVAPAPAILGNTNFRPSFIFGAANSATNDVNVVGIIAPGKVAGSFNAPHTISAVVKNASNTSLTNIPVDLNIGGANTFTASTTILSLAAGSSVTVNFAAFNPTVSGLNTISVSCLPDQNNLNNTKVYTQSVTCNTWSQNQPNQTFASAVGFNTASGIIASRYQNPITSTLTAMNVAIGNTAANAGNSVYCVLMNSGGVIQAFTNTITLSAAMFNTMQTFTFASQTLAPGTYYLGLAQPANTVTGYFPLAASPAPYVPTTIYYTSVINGGFVSSLTQNLGYFAIEGVFAHTTTISATSPSSVVCDGASITLTGNGATTYTWSTGPTTPTISVSPTVATSYSVVGTNSMGCTANASVSLAINPSPTVTASAGSASVCPGGSVSLTANGADTYSWSTGATTTITIANPTVTTTFSVVGTNSIGCSSTGTVAVAMNIPNVVISSPTAICTGTSAVLSVSGANTYTWNTGSNALNIIVNPTVTTSYSVSGTNSVGCVGSQTLNLVVNPNPTVTAVNVPSIICVGETTTLTANGASNYTLYTNPGIGTINGTVTAPTSIVTSPTTSASYTIVGANNFGCTQTKFLTQTVNACVGIFENTSNVNGISLFPNPNNGVFTIDVNSILTIDIYNILGEKIKSLRTGPGKTSIDIKDQANGVYFINMIENNKIIAVSKIVKE